ncbi:MAG: hypothetical protein R3332_10625 [Pseudohongiellaceae bacterium]|nr:hypothetical protein [Pseudohongiellaceae bacterium]
MPRQIDVSSHYSEKLVKLIPTEIIGAYIAIEGMVRSNGDVYMQVMVAASIVLLLLVPLYLTIIFRVNNKAQIVVTMLSFLVWIFSMGGPFATQLWYLPVYGSVVLVLWTLIVPLFNYELDQQGD